MSSLYEINSEMLHLMNDYEAGTIEEDAFNDTWEALAIERSLKIEATISYIKSVESWASACKAEASVLTARAKSYTNQADKLKERLESMLEPREAYQSAKHQITWRSSTQTVVNTPTEQLFDCFKTTKITVTPNKKAIKDHLDNGGTLEGCELVEKLNMGIK